MSHTQKTRPRSTTAAIVTVAVVLLWALVGCAPTETKAPGVIPTSPPTTVADDAITASAT